MIQPMLIGVAAWIGFMVFMYLLCRAHDAHIWNDGVCRETGLSWRFFDVASDMSRGYRSERDQIRRCIWISTSVDKEGPGS